MLSEAAFTRSCPRAARVRAVGLISLVVLAGAVSACTTTGTPSGGASVGRVEGSQIARDGALGLTSEDRAVALQAELRALEATPAGAAVSWRNPETGHAGDVLPGPAYQVNAQSCRDYTHNVTAADQPASFQATACRGSDGIWQVVT
ncbi:RT0821/Lpp0805 family surface protein [Amorphus coralli]|uniref:RT0821/Lpp0805 family surface protein n=1 Tax=Amorphus coralli TaxID=340680 RepID=UPI0003F966A7|nr:RT0821/Lpp0805 family surface protein [Amorphus coralli]